MGRHSLPDPEESGGRRDEPQTERFGLDAHEGREPLDAADGEPGGDETLSDAAGFASADETGSAPAPRSREWDSGEWTGSHRAITPKRRGVSVGVVVALVAVVVVVGAVILWRFFGDALSSRSDVAAARCVDGQVNVPVVVDPAIADPVTALADRYNQTADPVGDKCVKIGVKPADSDQVVKGLSGDWPGDLGDRPAMWIPASSASEARLEAAAGKETVSDSRSLVTSPVVLAMSPQLKKAMGDQNWGTLPGLQTDTTALDGLGLQGWGGLRLALPLDQNSDAAYLAGEAVASAAAPSGSPASAGLSAVSTLVAGAPKLADPNAGTALDALVGAGDPATAPVHAVVTTEQRLFQRTSSLSDAKSKVAAWLPPGPTATADFPTVALAGKWLAQEQIAAASEFARFMRKPEQLGEFAKAGFRAQGANPPANDVVDFANVSAPLNVGDNALRATIAKTLSTPVQNATTTIVLDQSMPEQEGGKSRVANVVAALQARLGVLPPGSGVGLWTFDGVQSRTEVGLGTLSDDVNGRSRTDALNAALDSQTASNGGAVSFTTLRAVYADASAKFRDGQKNSVLFITTGPHTDQTLDGAGLQQYIKGAFDPNRPVAVNVIDFGDDSDRSSWESVTRTTGGSYRNLNSSDSPDLTSAVADLLG